MNDIEFLNKFDRCLISWDDWNHYSHIRMAYLFLTKYGNKDGQSKIINGIKKFNKFHSAKKMKIGYHETITLFWINQIRFRLIKNNNSFNEFKLQNQELFKYDYIYNFYDKEVLYSDNAKLKFIKPNRV